MSQQAQAGTPLVDRFSALLNRSVFCLRAVREWWQGHAVKRTRLSRQRVGGLGRAFFPTKKLTRAFRKAVYSWPARLARS